MADYETVRWSIDNVREYLYPPGDSGRDGLQGAIDRALVSMHQAATLEQTKKQVIIEIDPDFEGV